jgi:hypothetical protein
MAGETHTVSDYIVHHLTNLTFGKLPGGYHRHDGSTVPDGGAWVMAHGADEAVSEYIVHHLTNLTYGKLPGGFHRHDGSTVPRAACGPWRTAAKKPRRWASMRSTSIP